MPSDVDKLRVLLPHWIEHNAEHAAEFRLWAARAGEAGGDILGAATSMIEANDALQRALERLGGALAPTDHPHR